MSTHTSRDGVRRAKRSLLALALAGMAISQAPSCGNQSDNTTPETGNEGGTNGRGGGGSANGGHAGQSGQSAAGNKAGSSGQAGTEKGGSGTGGNAGNAGHGQEADTGVKNGPYTVSMVQSSKENASEITQDEIVEMVTSAVSQAGGLDFVHDGQTVVLKPNIVTPFANLLGTTPLDPQVNGVTTDWRVVKAVAGLVRVKNPNGKILVMEGSVAPAATAFATVGYTKDNFGDVVDEFLGFEGGSCREVDETVVVQKTGTNGKTFWLNKRYASADVVISIPTMKTHSTAGITGAVKNLGVGATPAGWYSATTTQAQDCTRGQTVDYIDHTSADTLGQFIHDYYSLRPADFVVMDGLQGLQNGPSSIWSGTKYETDKMNMRLILAGKNAVAVDTIEALVMKCDPTKVPHLTLLEADGMGTTDVSKIKVLGKQVSEVAKAFAGKQVAICPGPPVTDAGTEAGREDAAQADASAAEAGQNASAQEAGVLGDAASLHDAAAQDH